MMRVTLAPEPPDFDAKVRQPGKAEIRKAKAALRRGARIELARHWRKCMPELYEAFHGICAYVCVRVDPLTGASSVDHCYAKSSNLELAYEWTNYRFASARMNGRKGAGEDVLDPVDIGDDWFQLECFEFQVHPNPRLAPRVRQSIQSTIDRLGLNDSLCVARRRVAYERFTEDMEHYPVARALERLEEDCPFVARELVRRGLAAPKPPRKAARRRSNAKAR